MPMALRPWWAAAARVAPEPAKGSRMVSLRFVYERTSHFISSRGFWVAAKRGIENAYQLQKVTGLPIGQAYRVWADDWVQINFSTLNTLCGTLECKPGDLLVYAPDADRADDGEIA